MKDPKETPEDYEEIELAEDDPKNNAVYAAKMGCLALVVVLFIVAVIVWLAAGMPM